MTIEEIDKIKINFIVGVGRSGSTLLVAILNEYKNCIASNEIHHFIYFFKKHKNVTEVSNELINDYNTYLDLFFSHKYNPLIGPQNNQLLSQLKIGTAINYSQLTKIVYLGLLGTKGIDNDVNIIIDKNPFYTFEIDKIMSIFPEARVLVLVRDYRAYVLSSIQSRKLNVSKKNIEYYAYVWNLFNKYALKGMTKYPQSFKIIKYEDIALHKESTIKIITIFFGLEYRQTIFDFYTTINAKTESLNPTDKNYTRYKKKLTDLCLPIHAEKIFSWKKQLTQDEIEKIEVICGKIGKKFDYKQSLTIPYFKNILIKLSSPISWLKVLVFELLKSPDLHLYYHYKLYKK